MPDNVGTFELILRELARLVQPLEDRLAGGNVRGLFGDLGLFPPPELLTHTSFTNAVSATASAAAALPPLIVQLVTAIEAEDLGQLASITPNIVNHVSTAISSIDTIASELSNIGSLPGIAAGELGAFAAELPGKLVDFLIVTYLEGRVPLLARTLSLTGLIAMDPQPGVSGNPQHPAFVHKQLRFDRISQVFSSPDALLRDLYGWGTNSLDGTLLLRRLSSLLRAISVPVSLNIPASPGQPEMQVFWFKLKPTDGLTPPGLRLTMDVSLPEGASISLPFFVSGWNVIAKLRARLAAGAGLILQPPDNVSVIPPSGTLSGGVDLGIAGAPVAPQTKLQLIGQSGGTRLEAANVSASILTNFAWDTATSSARGDFGLEFKVEHGNVVVSLAGADGFLTSVLPSGGFNLPFDLTMGWTAERGFYFEGGAALEWSVAVHQSFGPINLNSFHFSVGLSTTALNFNIGVTGALQLGPITATVQDVGARLALEFHRGNLGPVNFAFSFKPPVGLGLAIDAGVVAGGGFILFNPDKGQYAGVFDLSLAEIVQVKIIGVLDTILPDGSHGFSFLLIITFDFPPIQLGFGFTLNGVGGLGGVNRTMNTDALHAGFRAHTLNSVLFPPDPIANAPQIISNIENFFPPAEGRYLFGPMLEIGWGTPTLITLAVGVILEVPDPVRLVLLGLIDAGLPTTEAALIELHIDVLGILDFGPKTLSIDGSLYDSRVLIFSLAGDLALRLSWGDNPNFLFSLGGFNPHFSTAGLDVPQMHRLTVSIGDGDNPRISANSYFAITSNSLQFGSNVEAYASAAGFTIHGWLGFDVLIIFSPFSFEFDFSAGFDVSFEGVSLCGLSVNGLFSGPRPWHLHGDATIDILFFSVSATLDITWGDSTPAILPAKPVLPDLLPAFQDPRNWSTALPDGTTQAATLSTPKPDDKTLRVHPMGSLSVRENVVPLDLPITRYGNATPSDGNYFAISDVQIDGHEENKQNFQDYFAPGQFLTLSDADKVSHPSFERYDAGIKIGSSEVLSGADSPRTVFYEERYIDEPTGFSRFARRYAMAADVHLALTAQGAGFESPLKNTGLFKYGAGAAAAKISTQDAAYVVAHVEDLSVRSDIVSSSGGTYYHARAALDTYIALHPEESSNLQILPVHEVTA